MQVVEQFTCSKVDRPEENEDGLLVTPHFAAVIDGATSQSARRWDGQRSGRMATRTLLAALAHLDAHADAPTAIANLTEALAREYRQRGVYDELAQRAIDRWTAGAIVYSRARHEVWLVGDCQARVLLGDGTSFAIENPKAIDHLTTSVRCLIVEAELLQGRTVADLLENDPGREFILPLLARQYQFQNIAVETPWSYWVLDGFPVAPAGIHIHPLPPDAIGLLLASDGYPMLLPTLAETEAHLEQVLTEDPLCLRRHASTKGLGRGRVSFDDRTYLRLALGRMDGQSID